MKIHFQYCLLLLCFSVVKFIQELEIGNLSKKMRREIPALIPRVLYKKKNDHICMRICVCINARERDIHIQIHTYM